MATILQFGTGRFLRGFFCPVVQDPNSIVVIQSRTDSSGAATINRSLSRSSGTDDSPLGYHVWTRGKIKGQVVDDFEVIRSIDRAVVAHSQWDELLSLAIAPDLRMIVSNTTEQGLTRDAGDDSQLDYLSQCPSSFPAKLVALLHYRYQAGLNGLTILPLELVEYNASRLLQLVKEQAAIWLATHDSGFVKWLESQCRWLNNLVDRIVVGVTDPPPWSGKDPIAVVGEPFRLLAIEDDGGPRQVLPAHEMIEWVPDLKPIFVRKVRILNGLHTAMVAHSLPQGFQTVLEAVSDPAERRWLESLLHDEILPTLQANGRDEKQFAAAVMERFENPFFRHQLADIANGHATKLTTRIQPTIDEFREAFAADGKQPKKLCEVMSGART